MSWSEETSTFQSCSDTMQESYGSCHVCGHRISSVIAVRFNQVKLCCFCPLYLHGLGTVKATLQRVLSLHQFNPLFFVGKFDAD